ncbi:MAG TPA: hypothetical protein VJ044_10340, partial [Candidatus Hodarchaeales archaeon]|nr:hypothetical protein [Candidatus Hodarchaeales archaeon]
MIWEVIHRTIAMRYFSRVMVPLTSSWTKDTFETWNQLPDPIQTILMMCKKDISIALDVWKQILVTLFGGNLIIAYAKGSAVKPWESNIDYVPILSDLDIHILLENPHKTFFTEGTTNAIETALQNSEKYETLFFEANPGNAHLPRIQVMFIEDLKLDPNYVPPLEEQCRMIIGQWKALEYPSEDEIRLRDKKSLLAQDEFIRQLPKKIFDRTDLDFWQTLRQISWRVSPSP